MTITQRRGINICSLKGHITVSQQINIDSTLKEYKLKPLLFDLTECESIDISILLLFTTTLQQRKNIKFFGMKESIKSLLINKKLIDLFPLHSDLNSGINSFN